uniref:Uncharacterized protein n=1 Tax=Ditylenchus dipsaci TaxID=166011 RepID=A0A915EI08_9BILA
MASTDVLLPSCSSTYGAPIAPSQQPTAAPQTHYRRSSSSSRRSSANRQKYETMFVQNTVALAVIHRLHQWCCQLFWLTIVCVIGCCGELQGSKSETLADVRRSIAANGSQRRCKTVTDLEMQLLRHLTCPQTAILRPLRQQSSRSIKKRQHLSRPPSPQLFDIFEEEAESQ